MCGRRDLCSSMRSQPPSPTGTARNRRWTHLHRARRPTLPPTMPPTACPHARGAPPPHTRDLDSSFHMAAAWDAGSLDAGMQHAWLLHTTYAAQDTLRGPLSTPSHYQPQADNTWPPHSRVRIESLSLTPASSLVPFALACPLDLPRSPSLPPKVSPKHTSESETRPPHKSTPQ